MASINLTKVWSKAENVRILKDCLFLGEFLFRDFDYKTIMIYFLLYSNINFIIKRYLKWKDFIFFSWYFVRILFRFKSCLILGEFLFTDFRNCTKIINILRIYVVKRILLLKYIKKDKVL